MLALNVVCSYRGVLTFINKIVLPIDFFRARVQIRDGLPRPKCFTELQHIAGIGDVVMKCSHYNSKRVYAVDERRRQ